MSHFEQRRDSGLDRLAAGQGVFLVREREGAAAFGASSPHAGIVPQLHRAAAVPGIVSGAEFISPSVEVRVLVPYPAAMLGARTTGHKAPLVRRLIRERITSERGQ